MVQHDAPMGPRVAGASGTGRGRLDLWMVGVVEAWDLRSPAGTGRDMVPPKVRA